ncbi:MAG: DUF4304 domain-containing protein [bacterium]
MKIFEIQNKIQNYIGQCLSNKGFDIDNTPTFYNLKDDIIRIIHISFLRRRDASYFNSNTASFNLNLGVNYNFKNIKDFHPKEYESHIRGCLLKDFSQKNPMNLKGFPLFHPERKRRDIWWVENNASNLEHLLANVSRIIDKNAIKWLDNFSDIAFTIRFLKKKKEIDSWKGGPFGFGSIVSPYRLHLIKQLQKKQKQIALELT